MRPAVPSLPHLSLEAVHQRGWGSAYAALARGRIDSERLRDLLVRVLSDAGPLVFAVDVTSWPRCDAECSPERGYYYHPSRHSAGQPIIAGWAFQWIAQLSFDRPAADGVVGPAWPAPLAGGAVLSWLSCFRRLQLRWDRDSGRWFAFVLVACAVVCFNRL